MEAWQTILLAFGGNAALLAVLGWISKSFVEKMIARDDLRFRHKLEMIAVEHEVRFLKLHETRAVVIAQLYELIAKVQWECARYSGPKEWMVEEPLDIRLSTTEMRQRPGATFEAIVAAYRYFDANRIYLPSEAGQKLDALLRSIWEEVERLSYYERGKDIDMLGIDFQDVYEARKRTWGYLHNQFLEARRALETEFRMILGDNQSERILGVQETNS